MSAESVYVKPIIVQRANPMTVQDLQQTYQTKHVLIQERLKELRKGWGKSDEGVFAELCYGILLARQDAARTLPLVAELESSRLLFDGTNEQIQTYLRQHHYALWNRSIHIVSWREKFTNQETMRIKYVLEGKFKRTNDWDILGAREYLAYQKSGVGWKVASQFLRNVGVGLGCGLALLDRHIQKELKKFNYVSRIYKQALRRTQYLEYEKKMMELATDSSIPMDDLDLLIWSNKTGLIIK